MRGSAAILHVIHVATLGLWFGCLAMSGVAAAVIFPTMKALNPALPEYAAYTGPHWMLAAGAVASKIFLIGDVVQFVCAMLAMVSLLLAIAFCALPWRNAIMAVRITCLAAALLALAFELLVLAPRMNVNLKQYWAAAKAGDNTTAETRRQAFSEDHPTASTTLVVTTMCVGAAFILAAWPGGTGPTAGSNKRRAGSLEDPALLKGRT